MARPRGLERAVRVAWALALHVGVPALIAWLPTTTGMRLRDFADFYPEQVASGGACVALLAAGGLAKLCSEVGSRAAGESCAMSLRDGLRLRCWHFKKQLMREKNRHFF